MLVKSKNGSDYILSYVDKNIQSYWVDNEYGESHIEEFVEHQKLGYSVMSTDYTNPNVIVSNSSLKIGGKPILDYEDVCKRHESMLGKIPKLYVVRTLNDNFMGFQCGFDLLNDGRFWANGNYFDTIQECFIFLQEKYGDFYLFLEEEMRFD